jgi:transaldolase
MKIFLDTADVDAIRKAAATGLVDGVTTNPSKLAGSTRPFSSIVEEICSIVPGPVSVEAMGETAEDLIREAGVLATLAPNVVVKIPMTQAGLAAVPVLEREKKIRCNVTMIFSSTQAFLAMKAGASFASVVLSRLDACANESEILVEDAAAIKRNYGYESEIIAGSLKTQNHVLAALRAGIDVATIPEALFFQLFRHPLTDLGLAQFARDWEKVPK